MKGKVEERRQRGGRGRGPMVGKGTDAKVEK